MPLSEGLNKISDLLHLNNAWLDKASDDLASQGWYHGEAAIGAPFIRDVNQWLETTDASGMFKSAGVGKGSRLQNNQEIRRDRILWLNDDMVDPTVLDIQQMIEQMRMSINRQLYAGLVDFEGHFAIYPPGGFYQRHVDTFRDDDARAITFILYLNQNWTAADGGQLRLYTAENSFIDIEPRSGTVVLFRSRDFEHEVLPAQKERCSFTGWYRQSPRLHLPR